MTLVPQRDRSRPIRIALVDDHRLVVDGLTAHLAAHHPDITTVISVSSWAELLGHPDFPAEVTVIDLHLGDEIPIATKVRALSATGTHTIVMSRHADAGTIHGALRAGALGFVPKTETADELADAIRSAAAGERFTNRAVNRALDVANQPGDPGLGKQEHRAMALYAGGRSIREVAQEMSTTEETVKSYIKRGRRKYRDIGVDLGTKILLRRHAIREGWLSPE